MINEIETLRKDLDHYYEFSDDHRVWKKERDKWEHYLAKLIILKVHLKKARNFYYGVIS
jgi:hypothetical protein